MTETKEFLTIKEAANMLKLSRHRVRELCVRGEIKAHQIKKNYSWRIDKEALTEQFSKQNSINYPSINVTS